MKTIMTTCLLFFLSAISAHVQTEINQEKIDQLKEAAREANADPIAAQSKMQNMWMNLNRLVSFIKSRDNKHV